MSTYTSEPGTRLAGRYRLEDQVDAGGGWALWKAIDEILARAVTVLMFAEDFPRVREAVTAARAASRLNDSRLSQVFDVDDSGDRAYIVMEWVAGESLTDMLSDGPLDPAWAATIVCEAAQAISAAHAAGLAHLRLVPGSLRWTSGGGVKITGIGMDAAIAGVGAEQDPAEDPALTDTRQLAWLMYAAVTGYWPGPGTTPLPPAPAVDGAPCSPRQVSAGVPAAIDSIICQGMFQRHGRNGTAITTPIGFADALAEVALPAQPIPPPYDDTARIGRSLETGPARRYGGQQAPATDPAKRGRPGPPARRKTGYGGGQRRTSGTAKALISVVIVLVLAAVGAVAWSVGHTKHGGSTHAGGGPSRSAGPSTAAAAVLKPMSATAADNPAQASAAIDGTSTTGWNSQFYIGSPAFGNLKKGSGLILNMGHQVRLSQVTVQFASTCCTAADLEVGNSDNPASESGFTPVATTPSQASGTQTFNVTSQTRGQYVMIWFTSLPQMAGSPNQYQAVVYNVVVRGSG